MDNELIKTTPPVGVSAMSLLGMPLSDWVYLVTIIYVLVQMFVLLDKTYWKEKRNETK